MDSVRPVEAPLTMVFKTRYMYIINNLTKIKTTEIAYIVNDVNESDLQVKCQNKWKTCFVADLPIIE